MPHRVSRLVKITSIGSVEFRGRLVLRNDDWFVATNDAGDSGDELDPWLEKFRGENVRITIEKIGSISDDSLLVGEPDKDGGIGR